MSFRGTRKQAEAELAKRLSELAEGRYVAPTVETVESYARHWLVNIAPAERSPLPLERYTSIIRAHIIPRLGPIPLQALDGKAFDGFYAHCRKQGRRDGAGLNQALCKTSIGCCRKCCDRLSKQKSLHVRQ